MNLLRHCFGTASANRDPARTNADAMIQQIHMFVGLRPSLGIVHDKLEVLDGIKNILPSGSGPERAQNL